MQKNPGVSAVLSFFVPGLGQIYNGNFGKGLIHLLIGVLGVFLFIEGSFPVGIPTAIILINTAISCFNAYHDAESYNESLKHQE